MTRRLFLVQAACLPVVALADSAEDAWDEVAAMAAALAEDNASGFLKRFDKDMPGYQELESKVTALLQQADVESHISALANDGGPAERTLQLDWQLRMKPKGFVTPLSDEPQRHSGDQRLDEREEAVTIVLRRDGKKWHARKLEPIAFFAPPNFR
jgi:hypothetical protein